MDEEIICVGCGAALQDHDPNQAGYLPTSALKKFKQVKKKMSIVKDALD